MSVLLEGQEKKHEQERARQEGERKWEIVNPYMVMTKLDLITKKKQLKFRWNSVKRHRNSDR